MKRTLLVIAALVTSGALVGPRVQEGSVATGLDRVPSVGVALEAAAPAYRDITIPAGTVLPIALDSYVASDSSRVEDAVRAHLRHAVVVRGVTAIPAGSTLAGIVTDVERPGRVKGRARLAFRFTRLALADSRERLDIRTSSVARQAAATKGEDAATIGLPAAGGAIIGAIAGGKKGAAIGAAAGGGAGTAVVLSTRGREVRLGRGALASVRLMSPVTVRVRL